MGEGHSHSGVPQLSNAPGDIAVMPSPLKSIIPPRTVANAFEGSSYTSHAQSNRGQPVHNERRESNAQKHVQHQTSTQDTPVESNQVQHSATFNTGTP